MPIFANVIQDAFSPLISLFESIMVFIHAHLAGGSWGLAIVGLTVLVRAVLVPLTYRQLKSMQEMQRLAPEINKLKEKYKDDKQRQQQEIMKFYQENKINPLASCLPLLLQLPVFISLFYMLRTDLKFDICGKQMREFYSRELHRPITKNSQIPEHAVKVMGHTVKGLTEIGCSTPFHSNGALHTIAPGSAKFLFIPDITFKATGVVLIVLMLLLPLVFVVILYRYPAGLLVYWITTNLWTVGQQYLIKRHMGPPPAPAEPVRGSPNGKADRVAKPAKPALAGAGVSGAGGGSGSSPPPPPRKKKKRSGRRR